MIALCRYTLLFAAAAAAALISCGGDQPLAGGTDMPPDRIAGVLRDSTGAAAVNAGVSLYRTSTADSASWPVLTATTVTDTAGCFAFDRLYKGSYFLEASTADSRQAAYIGSIGLTGSGVPVEVQGIVDTMSGLDGSWAWTDSAYQRIVFVDRTSVRKTLDQSATQWLLPGLAPGGYMAAAALADQSGKNGVIVDTASFTARRGAILGLAPFAINAVDTVGMKTLDDFEDHDYTPFIGTGWWVFNDARDGGNSTVTPNDLRDSLFVTPGAGTSLGCFRMKFTLGTVWTRYCGMGTFMAPGYGPFKGAVSMENATGLSIKLKGSAPVNAGIVIYSDLAGAVTCLSIDSLPQQWTEYTVDFGRDVTDPAFPRVKKYWSRFIVTLSGPAGFKGEVYVDDIRLLF